MSVYKERYKERGYAYNSKNVKDGTVELVKKLKADGMTFTQIGQIIGTSRQRAYQIYNKSVASKF